MNEESFLNTCSATTAQMKTSVPDPYDWQDRHRAVIAANKERNPRLILIGDSITHYWGGRPDHPIKRGEESWNEVFERYSPVNMGFGMDRTENVIWRLLNGELENISPQVAILLVGINNFATSSNREIAEGIFAVVNIIHAHLPYTRILLLGLLPSKSCVTRVRDLNAIIEHYDGIFDGQVTFADPGKDVFFRKDGTFRDDLFCDGLHPNASGNRALAAAIKPILDRLMSRGAFSGHA